MANDVVTTFLVGENHMWRKTNEEGRCRYSCCGEWAHRRNAARGLSRAANAAGGSPSMRRYAGASGNLFFVDGITRRACATEHIMAPRRACFAQRSRHNATVVRQQTMLRGSMVCPRCGAAVCYLSAKRCCFLSRGRWECRNQTLPPLSSLYSI